MKIINDIGKERPITGTNFLQRIVLSPTKMPSNIGKQVSSNMNYQKKNNFSSSSTGSKTDPSPEAMEELTKPTLDIDPFKKSVDKKRPMSPHFVIYEPQITWLGSIAHRITGIGFAFGK